MNLLGYLITWANLQNFGGAQSSVKNISIRVADVQTLAQQIRSQPEYSLESLNETGYSRVGNVGKYLSKNLREYLNHGNVDPKEDGLILTLYYKSEVSNTNRKPLSFFIQRHFVDDDVSKKIDDYLDKIQLEKRNKRYIVPGAKSY
ncbi:hypothetical protein K1T71_005694 [Dendrolimus kikuchii]|uniref:Uncharacterized protein n=1 Tax=Dendrolimus kikuchii TaxID=765133 RepID=A0ACC1D4R0_9NEOP|nr:hypothetical protein K1T71_005694 [Dendrolimus kikuchii]